MLHRNASAEWRGNLKLGGGTVSTASGALDECLFGFRTRFENDPGTNPEELIAAAHAACFSMQLSDLLSKEGYSPERLDVQAQVSVSVDEVAGATIKTSDLTVHAKAPGLEPEILNKVARDASRDCPVSRALNLEISVIATVV